MHAVLWDLDGVLADNTHAMGGKAAYSELTDAEWEAFFALLPYCEPVEKWVRLWHRFHSIDVSNIVLTNRKESQREMTQEWLARHNLYPDMLLMRDESRGHVGAKADRVPEVRAAGYTILMAIDDDPAHCRDYERHEVLPMYVPSGYHAGVVTAAAGQ